jgi:hypothetical protein
VALFTKKQTLPRSDFKRVPASKLPKRASKPVYYNHHNGRLYLWVGSRKDLITLMQENKFRYWPQHGRYWREASDEQVQKALDVIRSMGYTPVEEAFDSDVEAVVSSE